MPLTLSPVSSRRFDGVNGPRLCETFFPSDDFWRAWRGSKDSLKSLGYSVRKEGERWLVDRYSDVVTLHPAPEHANGYSIRDTSGLLPYQVPSAGRLCAAVHKFGSALDASDTGTGKTYTALAVCRELGLRPAIVCPKSIIYSWARVCALFGITPIFIANWEACKSKLFRYGAVKPSGDYEWRIGSQPSIIIFDEAHKAKGEWTLNSKLVIAAKRQALRALLLSATIASQPREMKALGFTLGLHKLYDFNEWAGELGCYRNRFDGWDCADPLEAMKKISADIFPAKGSRIRIAELGDAFPESQVSAEVYDIGKYEDKQNTQYQDLLEEIERLLEQKKDGYTAAILNLNLRYRQITEGYKAELLAELAREYIDNGLSVAIFVNFTATLESLQAKLEAPVVHGQQDEKEREKAVDAFQSDAARSIVLNIKAGGVGLSLHDLNGKYPRVSLICPTYSAIDLKQSLGRVHRAGGMTKSLQRLIYAKGTIEEEVCKKVARKLTSISALNDGDLMEDNLLGVLHAA